MSDKRTVLVVGMGISPVVMPETVWALAHREHLVVPDEIGVFTTKNGKMLRGDEDNLRAADFMIVQSPHGTDDSSVELLYRLQVTARR